MGYYVQGPTHGKVKFIIDTYNAIELPEPPKTYTEIGEGNALIVVVDNGMFEAAGFCYDEREFDAWIGDYLSGRDTRLMRFVLMDRNQAEELSGFREPATK